MWGEINEAGMAHQLELRPHTHQPRLVAEGISSAPSTAAGGVRPLLRRVCFKSPFFPFSFFYHRVRRVGRHWEQTFYKWCDVLRNFESYHSTDCELFSFSHKPFFWSHFLVLSAVCKNWNPEPKCDSIRQTPHQGCMNLQRETYLTYLRHLFQDGMNLPLQMPLSPH